MSTVSKSVRTDRVKGGGKRQHQRTDAGKLHTPNLARYYEYGLPDLVPGDFRFELALLRPKLPPLPLRTVESLSWDDEASAETGSLSVHRPVPGDPDSLPIEKGHLVRCRVKWGEGHHYQLWAMRCGAPETQVDTNIVTVALHDDMALLKAGSEDWIFRKTKHRPHGWTAAEITMEVARRRGLKVKLPLPKCKKKMSLVKRKTSAFKVLVDAWAGERDHAGIPFVMRMVGGELEITTLRRNAVLYVLQQQIETALIQARGGGSGTPPTILEGTAKIGKGKESKKIHYTEFDRHAIRLLGNVRHHKDYGTVSSHSELRKLVQRDLAKMLRVQKTVTITHAGIPFIRRGDAARVVLPAEGYDGRDGFVFCSRANHTVEGGVYSTEFEFTRRDLFIAAERAALNRGKGASAAQGTGTIWAVRVSLEDAASGDGWTELSSNGNGAATAGGTQSPNCTGNSVGACDFATLGQAFPHGTQLIISKPDGSASAQAGLTDVGNGSSFAPAIGITPALQARLGGVSSGETLHIQLAGGGSLSVAPGFGTVVK